MSETRDTTLWLTVPEAREYLKVSKTTLYNLMKDRRLPFYYISGTRQRRVKQADLEALLQLGNPDELDTADEDSE
jgi:excisionase family DNA binding protein